MVEYEQNAAGKILSRILPDILQPSMREGDPVVLSPGLDSVVDAKNLRNRRRNQLRLSGRLSNKSVEVEEIR